MEEMDQVGNQGDESEDEDDQNSKDIDEMEFDDMDEQGEDKMSEEPVVKKIPGTQKELSDDGEADPDMDTNIASKRDKHISDLLKKEDLGLVQMRIRENIKVLSNFKELRKMEKSRGEYLEEIKADICQAYDYNKSLMGMIFDLFPPAEALEFIEANENARPLTIRTNTLKTKRKDLAKALIQRGV